MNLKLRGRKALVVGGSGYVGRAISATLLEEGVSVVIGGRTESALRDVMEELSAEVAGASIGYVVVDTADTGLVTSAVESVANMLGGIDIVVNSGAPAAAALIRDAASGDEIDEVMSAFDGKALGYLRVARSAVKYLAASDSGRIVNVCGQHVHLTDSMPATLRNAAVAAMSKTLADDLADVGVTVNVIHPGPVGDHSDGILPKPDLGEPGATTPSAIAHLVAYLSSPVAQSVSGAAIDVGHRVYGVSGF